MPRQKNTYILNLKNGGEARAICSTLDEAKLIAAVAKRESRKETLPAISGL